MAPHSSASPSPKPESIAVAMDEPASSQEEPQGKQPEISAIRFSFLALGVCLGLFLSFIDTSIVATSLFSIGTDFGDLDQVNWVAISYTLAYMGLSVFFARISDVVGRRDAFLAAYVIFFAFSIGCGFAQSMHQLIACRTLQGIGGSGLYSLTMIILIEISPVRFRAALASVVGIVMAIGGVLGPVLGGILTHYATWRWVFWINGPICAVSAALFYLAWPKVEYLPPFKQRKWSELDYTGSFLLIAASTLVVFPFQNASSSNNPWTRAVFLAPLLAGVGCWIALITWTIIVDRRWGGKLAAAFPMQLMRDRVYTAAILNTSCLGFAFIMTIYAFPLRLQVVNGKSALSAGVMLLPLLGASALGSMVSGAINGKRNWICETLVISSCSVVLGCGLLSTQSASSSVEAKALGFLVFVGLGFGMSAASATMLAHLRATAQDQGKWSKLKRVRGSSRHVADHDLHHTAPAQGILAQVRILGGSMGIAASSAILSRHLSGVADPGQLASIEHHRDEYTADQLQAIREAFSEAFNNDMYVCAIVSAVGVLLACGVWTRERRKLGEDQEEEKISNEGFGVKRK